MSRTTRTCGGDPASQPLEEAGAGTPDLARDERGRARAERAGAERAEIEPAGATARAAAIARAVHRLTDAGVASPAHDARALLGHATGEAPLAARLAGVLPLERAVLERFEALVAARARRVPLQHLLGMTGFHAIELTVRPGVFVPRPETEVLVEAALERLRTIPAPRVLDLCTGTAAIALAVAAGHRGARVVAIEQAPCAAALAAENVARLALGARVAVVRADLACALAPPPHLRFDAILSNPPYVRRDALAALEPEVRLHDPIEALDGGADGLDVVRRIAAATPSLLAPGGFLAIEIGADQGEAARREIAAAGAPETTLLHDLAGRPRVVVTGPWTSS